MGAAPAVAPAARRALNANLGTITNLPSSYELLAFLNVGRLKGACQARVGLARVRKGMFEGTSLFPNVRVLSWPQVSRKGRQSDSTRLSGAFWRRWRQFLALASNSALAPVSNLEQQALSVNTSIAQFTLARWPIHL